METNLQINIQFCKGDTTWAKEGMGWYLWASYVDAHEGKATTVQVIPFIRLSAREVGQIGQVLEKFANGKPLNWVEQASYVRSDRSLSDIINKANEQAAELAKTQLADAEEYVKKLELLRSRAEEWSAE